jgi:hypothetical protein
VQVVERNANRFVKWRKAVQVVITMFQNGARDLEVAEKFTVRARKEKGQYHLGGRSRCALMIWFGSVISNHRP